MMLMASGGGAAPVTYTISGTVYDADGTTTVEGATVALGALSAVSAADGTYTIADVPSGTSGTMSCTKTGYSWVSKSIASMSGDLTAQNFVNWWWAVGGIAEICIGAYQPMGAASLAASYINLANPTNNAAPGSAPSFDTAVGWTFSDTHWLGTNIIAAANYSMIGRFSGTTARASGHCVMGCGSLSTNRLYVLPGLDVSNRAFGYGLHKSFAGAVDNGVMAIAGENCYYNGAVDGVTAGSITSGELEIQFGRRWKGSGFDFPLNGNIQAAAIYSAVLTAPQVAALTTAINNLP
jgi:hypothetical protein